MTSLCLHMLCCVCYVCAVCAVCTVCSVCCVCCVCCAGRCVRSVCCVLCAMLCMLCVLCALCSVLTQPLTSGTYTPIHLSIGTPPLYSIWYRHVHGRLCTVALCVMYTNPNSNPSTHIPHLESGNLGTYTWELGNLGTCTF
jgi:hypothetical protein